MIEKFYSPTSLESSNSYFLLGVYYASKSAHFTHKSIACFGKALSIRERKKDCDASCADCLLNMGLLYKRQGMNDYAEEALKRALKIRLNFIGPDSL